MRIQGNMDSLSQHIEMLEKASRDKFLGEGYSECFIVFLDIMGMKELVNQSFDVLAEVFGVVDTAKELYGNMFVAGSGPFLGPNQVRATVMSDSIVISTKADNENAFSKLMGFTSYILKKLISTPSKPVFVRGGIARGDLYHKNDIVFGPSLIRAYKLELKEAHSMRCILDPELEDNPVVREYIDSSGSALRRDLSDDYFFVPFAQESEISKLKDVVSQILENNSLASLHSKYEWLSEYINDFEDALQAFQADAGAT